VTNWFRFLKIVNFLTNAFSVKPLFINMSLNLYNKKGLAFKIYVPSHFTVTAVLLNGRDPIEQ